MRSRKAIGVLCYGLAVCLLAASLPANAQDNLPPAISMLKNLKKNSATRPVIADKYKSQIKQETASKVIVTKKAVSKPLAVKPTVPKSSVFKAFGKREADKPKGEMATLREKPKRVKARIETMDEAENRVSISHDIIQFNQDDLQKREDEVNKGLMEARERETAAGIAYAKYLTEHRHEMKLNTIADGLANRKPAMAPDRVVNEEWKSARSIKSPENKTELSLKNKSEPKTEKISESFRKNLPNNAKIGSTRTSMRDMIERAARRNPAAVRVTSDEKIAEAGNNDLPLPEGAELVAGNPYNDEFFIVTKDSPDELKQLAENAKNKDYLPPVVVAAVEKRTNDRVVKTLIKKVANRAPDAARYVSDPFIHYMTEKKIESVSKPKAPTSLSKSQYASEKITTRVFNSSLSEKAENEELTKLVKQLEIQRNAKRQAKLVASKSGKNHQAILQYKGVKFGFKPEIKQYADMVKIKHYPTKQPKLSFKPKVQLARHQPMATPVIDLDDFKKGDSIKAQKGHESAVEKQLAEQAAKNEREMPVVPETKMIVQSQASSMNVEVERVKKNTKIKMLEDADVMNDAF